MRGREVRSRRRHAYMRARGCGSQPRARSFVVPVSVVSHLLGQSILIRISVNPLQHLYSADHYTCSTRVLEDGVIGCWGAGTVTALDQCESYVLCPPRPSLCATSGGIIRMHLVSFPREVVQPRDPDVFYSFRPHHHDVQFKPRLHAKTTPESGFTTILPCGRV